MWAKLLLDYKGDVRILKLLKNKNKYGGVVVKKGKVIALILSGVILVLAALLICCQVSRTDTKIPHIYEKDQTGLVDNGSKWDIDLEYTPDKIVARETVQQIYEYSFTNKSSSNNMVIKLMTEPETVNMKVSYAYSDSKISDLTTIVATSGYEDQLISGGASKYIYLVATVIDNSSTASFSQDMKWRMGKPIVLTCNVGNGTTITSYAIEGAPLEIAPEVPNREGEYYDFNGWYTDSGFTEELDLTKNIKSSQTIYAKYVSNYPTANLPSDYIGWDSSTNSYQVIQGSSTLPTNLVIPETYNDGTHGLANVTHIMTTETYASGAFYNKTTLKSVSLPRTMTDIGKYAFYMCKGLTSVSMPSCITAIRGSSLRACTSLTSIVVPRDVTHIEYGAFKSSTAITSLSVEEGNTVFDSRDNCNAIIETATNKLAFACKTSIIPETVVTVGSSAFEECLLTSIAVPASVTVLEVAAFYNCPNLKTVNILGNIVSMGYATFKNCVSLTSIVLPASLAKIGNQAFQGCTNLTSVTFKDTSTWYYTSNSGYTGGTKVTVTNATTNATYLKTTYASYYWYKV